MAETLLVSMTHPDIEGVGTTTPEAFREVWAEKGWTLVSPDAELTKADPGRSNKQGANNG